MVFGGRAPLPRSWHTTMANETIRQHDYLDGRCQHCGDLEAENVDDKAGRSCIARAVPRAVPTSIFAHPGEIGDRAAEIRAEENAARNGSGG